MKECKYIISLFLISLLAHATFAQHGQSIDIRSLSAKKLKLYGKNADRLGDVYSAIDFLEPYCKIKPGDLELNYRLAELYLASRDYAKAEKLFAKVYKNDVETYPQALFFEALAMKYQGKYAEAKEIFTKFQRKLKQTKNPPINSAGLKDEVISCENAVNIVAKPLKVNIDHLGSSVNGPHEELSPLMLGDSMLLYSSLKLDSTYYFTRDDTTSIPVRQFYFARKMGSDWVGGQRFDNPVNMEGVETGNGAISRTTQIIQPHNLPLAILPSPTWRWYISFQTDQAVEVDSISGILSMIQRRKNTNSLGMRDLKSTPMAMR